MEIPTDIKPYCHSLTSYKRWETREVNIGGVPLGGNNPIRVQSMTTTNTMDTIGTVEQSIRMIEAGCEYVRITAPSMNEARNLENIKKELGARGYETPLVADIHFTPNAAELAARIVEKVRVNPGNYADKKKFEEIDYSDTGYEAELERIRNKFTPLVNICKEYGTAMRIGTNHGSLSDRIMSRYGDTPLGMVESAFEFLRICESLNYYDIVLSMKASNVQVMVQAYRMLVMKMMETGRDYPIHLGVTEAGDGEDARIKSAAGIGTLLEDGIGDTIRVSLTEEPEAEIPVCRDLLKHYSNRANHNPIKPLEICTHNPLDYQRRKTNPVDIVGGEQVPVVVADLSHLTISSWEQLKAIQYHYLPALDKWKLGDMAPDFCYLGDGDIDFDLPGSIKKVRNYKSWKQESTKVSLPFYTLAEYLEADEKSDILNLVEVNLVSIDDGYVMEVLKTDSSVVLVLTSENLHAMAEMRRVCIGLKNNGIQNPVIFKRSFPITNLDDTRLYASIDFCGLMVDGFGDGVWLAAPQLKPAEINSIQFGSLQAARVRISKTEYIACPSCGRTLFDLQETTAMIRSRTNHLKGVKIGIMGCIVNGPGEMADADYGYVGSGPDKITLYRGKEVVKKAVPSAKAVDELIELIREDGNWADVEGSSGN